MPGCKAAPMPTRPGRAGDKCSSDPNYGYDDSRGDYLTVVGLLLLLLPLLSTLPRCGCGGPCRYFASRFCQPCPRASPSTCLCRWATTSHIDTRWWARWVAAALDRHVLSTVD